MSTALDLLFLTNQKYSKFQTFSATGVATSETKTGNIEIKLELHFSAFYQRADERLQFDVEKYNKCYFRNGNLTRQNHGTDPDGLNLDLKDQEISKTCIRVLQNLLTPGVLAGRNIFDSSQALIVGGDEVLDGEFCCKLLVTPKISPLNEFMWIGNMSHLVRAVQNEYVVNSEKLWSRLDKEQQPITKLENQHTINRIEFNNISFE